MDISLFTFLSQKIQAAKPEGRPCIIGINGVGGSGKTQFAEHLAEHFKNSGQKIKCLHIDDFHNPRCVRYQLGKHNPEGYYRHSLNFDAFEQGALRPLSAAPYFPTTVLSQSFNLAKDCPENSYISVDEDDIVLVEGIFLFRKNLSPYFHLKIFLDADEDVILRRVIKRDCDLLGSVDKVIARYTQKYFKGDKLYFKNDSPKETADIIIDNNNFKTPKIIKP